MQVDESELGSFAEEDLLKKMMEQYKERREPFSKSELRRLKPMSGSRVNELISRLIDKGLVYPVARTTERYAPDDLEDENLDEEARRESVASRLAKRRFERIRKLAKRFPRIARWLLEGPILKRLRG